MSVTRAALFLVFFVVIMASGAVVVLAVALSRTYPITSLMVLIVGLVAAVMAAPVPVRGSW